MNSPMAPTPAATAAAAPAMLGPAAAGRADDGPREASFAAMLGDARASDAAGDVDTAAPRECASRAAKPRSGSQAAHEAHKPRDSRAAATPTGSEPADGSPAVGPDAVAVAGDGQAQPAAEPTAAEDESPLIADLLPGWTPPAHARTVTSAAEVTPDARACSIAGAAITDTNAPRTTAARVEQALAPAADAARAAGAPTVQAAAADPGRAAGALVPQAAAADRAARAHSDDSSLETTTVASHKAFAADAVMRHGADVERLAAPAQGAAPAAALAGAAASTLAATSAAPVVQAHVSPPLGSALFAPALATQVRWLVGQGISQAQIQLNPAEMGPVSVRIVVEGREARIDFGADVAATRQVLESSLPVLAAALDDSGLKLTGGSVGDGQAGSQHAPHPHRPGSARATARGAIVIDGDAKPSAGAGAGAARGLVDLVA